MILPMVTVMGFVLHLPLIVGATQLLPTGSEFSLENAIILTWSTLSGLGFAAVAYLSPSVAKPIKLPSSKVQDLFAYDFYTPQLYRNTIIGLVAFTSTVLNSFDRFFIDGLANSFGLATLFSGQSLRYSTSGQSQFYMMTMVIGIIGIVGWLCYPFLNAG